MSDFNLEFDHRTYNAQSLDMGQSAFLSSQFEDLSQQPAFGSLDQSKPPQLACQDMDLSAFMSSLNASYAF